MVYPRGKTRTYYYRFMFAGRIVHESAKTQSKTVALAAERARRRRLEENYNGIEKPKMPPRFAKAADEWLGGRAAIAASTRETYAVAVNHLKAYFKGLVCDVTPNGIAAYQRARASEGGAGATVNKELACLASILADHGLWEKMRRDVKRAGENESAGRALQPDEEVRLLEAVSRAGSVQGHWTPVYTATVVVLNTGLRSSEVRKLQWRNVDLEKRVLIVGKTKTEAGTGRPVPLTQPAWAALDMWASRFPNRSPEHCVFPACETGHVNPMKPVSNWRTAWRRACVAAGLPGLRFHDLRHNAATKMLENGVPIATVAQIMGWSASTAIRMAKRYGHIRPEAQRHALESIATGTDTHPILGQGVTNFVTKSKTQFS